MRAVGYEGVLCVTQLDDTVYVVRRSSWRFSTIARFNTTTHQRLTDIDLNSRAPSDIAACARTSRLCVADRDGRVWLVSPDGADIQRWLMKSRSDAFTRRTLSVTSSRLLVTSRGDSQLIQFDTAGGDELRRVHLPDYMDPRHAVESPTGTFVVAHRNTQLQQYQVSEVNAEGRVLRQFSGSLGWPVHIAVDSQGHILVADSESRRILLLDAQLALRRVVIDLHQLNDQRPLRLCYLEQSGQLLVRLGDSVAVFDVLQR